MKKYNFYAGPAILPEWVMQEAAKSVIEFENSGLSIIEMSHRSKDFTVVLDKAKMLVRDLYRLDNDYEVLFLQGGASLQFLMVPFNLFIEGSRVAYLDTGAWSSKAIKEAKYFGDVVTVASSSDRGYSYIPKSFNIPEDISYFHFTTNNTIYGTEIPDSSMLKLNTSHHVPIVADMSSNIFSQAN